MTVTATLAATSIVRRTLFRLESDLAAPTSLGELAAAEGVSPFHLTRAFALTVGRPPMDYLKRRRLSEAARLLCATGDSVTDIAFAVGYESAEGFSRAFRKMFGCAPSAARTYPQPDPEEAFFMSQDPATLPEPKFTELKPLKLVGTTRRYTMADRARIPAQWEETLQRLGSLMEDRETFGVCFGFEDDSFDYMVAITDEGHPDTEDLRRMTIPAGRYAVFAHAGDVTEIPATWEAIFSSWVPQSGEELGDGPEIERYEPGYEPTTPGGLAMWVPLKPS